MVQSTATVTSIPAGTPPITAANATDAQVKQAGDILKHAGYDTGTGADGVWKALAQFQADNKKLPGIGIDTATADALKAAEDDYNRKMEEAQKKADAAKADAASAMPPTPSAGSQQPDAMMMLIVMLAEALFGGDNSQIGSMLASMMGSDGSTPYMRGHNVSPSLNNEQVKANVDKIVTQLESYGWSKEAAAGIAGNIVNESSADPNAVGDNGRSHGLIQVNGARYEHMVAFEADYKKKNPGATELESQVAFINEELRNGPDAGAMEAGRQLQNVKSAGDAARIFALKDERMADAIGQPESRALNAEAIAKREDAKTTQVAAVSGGDHVTDTPGGPPPSPSVKAPPAHSLTT